ncbi:MAG TPA: hypothetical protein VL308_11050, partial [Gemmatimonadaceae bacterium]|nr:hypothetical protein [Gemmatimonadaceae bacterium]
MPVRLSPTDGTPASMGVMERLSRAALVVAIIAWLVYAAFAFGYFAGDLASAILGVLGLIVGAGAAYCLGR